MITNQKRNHNSFSKFFPLCKLSQILCCLPILLFCARVNTPGSRGGLASKRQESRRIRKGTGFYREKAMIYPCKPQISYFRNARITVWKVLFAEFRLALDTMYL